MDMEHTEVEAAEPLGFFSSAREQKAPGFALGEPELELCMGGWGERQPWRESWPGHTTEKKYPKIPQGGLKHPPTQPGDSKRHNININMSLFPAARSQSTRRGSREALSDRPKATLPSPGTQLQTEQDRNHGQMPRLIPKIRLEARPVLLWMC